VGISKVPISEAVKLLNQTAVMPNDPNEGDKERGYIIELDIFHQLHCLVGFLALVYSHKLLTSPRI
jgi:hypothetical protein